MVTCDCPCHDHDGVGSHGGHECFCQTKKLSWTQPQCERCWIKENVRMTEDNRIIIRQPIMVREADVERCSFCGSPTIVGIFVRKDPKTVPYPREEEE